MVGGGTCPQPASPKLLYPASPPPLLPPSHYRLFHGCERQLVERSMATLQASGFYWGPLPTAEAHCMLWKEPPGTFLVRDSSQGNHLFSVSVKMESGPVSVRVLFLKGVFWLRDLFSECPVKLLELAVERSRDTPLQCKNAVQLLLIRPLRRTRVLTLQQLCRQCLVIKHGREGLARLPIQPALKRYIDDFPFKI